MTEQRNRMNESQGDRYDRSMYEDASARPAREEKRNGLYCKFANFFCDDKENIKDIMQQLGNCSDDDERIKEELFLLLYFFIMTFEKRAYSIQNIILKNKQNLIGIIDDFHEAAEDEDTKQLMLVLINTLHQLQRF